MERKTINKDSIVVVPNAAFQEYPKNKIEEVFCKGAPINACYVNGKYHVSNYTALRYQSLLSLVPLDHEIIGHVVTEDKGEKYKLLSYSQLKKLLEIYLTTHNMVPNTPSLLSSWLMLFCIYPQFEYNYQDYLMNPDSNVVEITTEVERQEFKKNFISELTKKELQGTNPIAPYEVKLACHLILVGMSKDYKTDTHSTEFMDRRKKACMAQLKVAVCRTLISLDFCEDYPRILDVLPKLKRMLFWFAYLQKETAQEMSTAILMISNTYMASIHEIICFIKARPKVKAHRHPIIINEVGIFTRAVLPKKKESGDLWPYYRILNPEDGSLNLSCFPNLATAAIFYKRARGIKAYEQFKTREVSKDIPDLMDLCKELDDQSIYKETFSEQGLDEDGLTELGIDLSKVSQAPTPA